MTSPRGNLTIEYPSELEIAMTRELAAPLPLVFDVLTKPEHVFATMSPFGERAKLCAIDLCAGGNYHFVFVTEDGYECSFRGTYLEVTPPTRTVQTWRFDGWPDVEAVETHELREAGGLTILTTRLAFRDPAGRARMTKVDGYEANLNHMEDLLRSLQARS